MNNIPWEERLGDQSRGGETSLRKGAETAQNRNVLHTNRRFAMGWRKFISQRPFPFCEAERRSSVVRQGSWDRLILTHWDFQKEYRLSGGPVADFTHAGGLSLNPGQN